MLGTHNSYTYLKAKNPFYEFFSFLWRTQDKPIGLQMIAGVNYFDIRVRRDGDVWRICHGLVDFDFTVKRLEDLLYIFSSRKVRIILERTSLLDRYEGVVEDFKEEIEECSKYPCLSFAAIKSGWKVIYDDGTAIMDCTYTPWLAGLSFWENIKRFNFFSTIKRWAKKHNPAITDEMKNSPQTVYFVDYV